MSSFPTTETTDPASARSPLPSPTLASPCHREDARMRSLFCNRSHMAGIAALLVLAPACAGDAVAPVGPNGPRVSVKVAALSLPGVEDVELALAVFNAAPSGTPSDPLFDVSGNVAGSGNIATLVWQNPSVTSSQYGNGAGGDVAYVGTCDASVAENWVAVALKAVDVGDGNGSYDGSGAVAGSANLLDDENSAATTTPGSGDGDADFVNPCDYRAPCVMKFRCAENEDTPVSFDLTVMRDAEQGFFDVAVDFADVFCSMKVDTCYSGGAPIELLFGADGERVPTAVLAAACSAGAGDDTSVLWMAPVTVSCDGGVSFMLDPTGDEDVDPLTPGLQGNASADATIDGVETDPGLAATGPVTFALALQGGSGGLTIPAGTVLTRSGGVQYTTDAAVAFGPADFSREVGVTAIAVGSAGNAPSGESLLALQLPDVGGQLYTIEVTVGGAAGGELTGGLDAVSVGGVHVSLGYAAYWGDEQLVCDPAGTSCNKAYWNLAINLDDLTRAGLENCRVTTAITASGGPALDQFVNGGLAGPGETYGYVAFDAAITEGSKPTCFQGPMGSEYAAAEYGASDDLIGANPFPHLCYYYQRGDASPRSLGDVEGYFADLDATPTDATYAGRLPSAVGAAPLGLAFDDMGGDATGPCRSKVVNVSSAVWFDGLSGSDVFSWRGSGGSGAYTIEVYGRVGSGAWAIRGGYMIDLRTELGRAFFAAGTELQAEGDTALALVVTRTDLPIVAVDDLLIQVGR